MKSNGRLVLAKVTCPGEACRVTGFSASIRLGSRSVRLGLAVPGPIAAGGTGRLVATVPSGIRRAVRKAKPKSIAHFGVTAVSDSKGRVQRPEMKVKVR